MNQIQGKQYINLFDTASRIAEAVKLFDALFGSVQGEVYSYLWTKQEEGDNVVKATYPFKVSDADIRKDMARRAITLSDEGKDVYIGVNCSATQAQAGQRYKAEQVTLQTATVTDIDVEGGNHSSTADKIYPPNFAVAKSFLPLDTSLVVDSGYGLHGYCVYSEPITITDENRAACETRNRKFIEAVRRRAGVFSKAVDGVGDLPRVLRVPGTYNYRLGRDNPPLCKLVEVNDIRFTPADMDERLAALEPKPVSTQLADVKPSKQRKDYQPTGDEPTDQERALAMLEVIPCAQQTYEDWVQVGMILKNNGNSVTDWTQWSRADKRFKDCECEKKWTGFKRGGLTIATLHMLAKFYGYTERDYQREWHDLRGDRKKTKPAPMEPPAEDNFVRTQDRIKSCPVNLRLPSNYLFGTNGIELVVPAKKENSEPKYVFVATPIVPVKSFRDASKGTVVYEMAILDKGKWHTTEVEGRTLSDPRAVHVFANFGASIDEAKYLCKFFTAVKLLNQDLIELKAYNQTGWTTEDYDDFALPSDDKSIVRRPGYDYERIFKPRGDREAWKNKFVEITEQGGAVAKTIIGTCCAAPLVRPLKLLNLQVHLHGKRSAGKTPLLKFGVSIYGDANVGALAYTFSATPKSRLETAAAFRDLPVIGEELESLSAREAEHLPQDIYNYALGIGGQALNKDQSRKEPKLFSGARLTSGEHPLVQGNGNGGEFKRVLELRCGQILDVDFAADLHGFCDDNRGLFGEQWIRYVVKHRATIAKHYHKALEGVKARQRSSAKANDDTQLATLVISAVAYQHFKICLGLQEVGNDKELEATLNAIICTLPTVDEIDDSQRAIEFLQSFVAGNEKSFVHMVRDTNNTGRVIDVAQYNAECYGKIYPDGCVAFLPHALKKILQNQGGFKSADKLIAEFADQGKIEVSLVKGNPLGYAKIRGCTKRAYIFKSGVIHDSESELSESDESVG